jgi:hypothetical protein
LTTAPPIPCSMPIPVSQIAGSRRSQSCSTHMLKLWKAHGPRERRNKRLRARLSHSGSRMVEKRLEYIARLWRCLFLFLAVQLKVIHGPGHGIQHGCISKKVVAWRYPGVFSGDMLQDTNLHINELLT